MDTPRPSPRTKRTRPSPRRSVQLGRGADGRSTGEGMVAFGSVHEVSPEAGPEGPRWFCLRRGERRRERAPRNETCPVSTGGGTKRVHLVREGGGGEQTVPPLPHGPRRAQVRAGPAGARRARGRWDTGALGCDCALDQIFGRHAHLVRGEGRDVSS